MNKKIKTDAVDSLFDAVLCLQSREECYSFFEDLCTVNELLSLSQRFEVAAMLKDGKTYLEIAEKTGLASMITAHPRGLDLPISEGGRGLSGGQRNRFELNRRAQVIGHRQAVGHAQCRAPNASDRVAGVQGSERRA